MKPGFALILSQDGISLLHRAKGGWRVLGNVDPSDPELDAKLRYLQRTATELSGGQFATKLVIPNAQILYRNIEAAGFTDELRTALIHASLDGTTPYALDELVFDWADAGDDIAYVAVVATETLKEAEKFAQEHRFNPVSFVAMPEPGTFDEEPFFGETDFSETLLSDGDRVEPDDDPIEIIAESEVTETPVIAVPEQPEVDQPPVELKPAFKHVELHTEVEALKDETLPTEAGFSTRRDTSAPPRNDGPLDLKWVTPRIAVPAGEKKSNISQTAEITPMAVTAPKLVGEVKTPNIRLKKTGKAQQENLNTTPKPGLASKLIDSAKSAADPESMTVFGSQDEEPTSNRNRILVATLGLAAVASFVLVGLFSTGVIGSTDGTITFGNPAEIALSTDLGEAQTATAVVASANFDATTDKPPEGTSPVAGIEVASLSAPDISTIELALPTPEEIAEARSEPDKLEVLTPDRAQAAYGLTGIWQMAPDAPNDPVTGRVSDLYVASIDRAIIVQDAIALPAFAASRPDNSPGFITPPAPAGSVFELDERGLVKPSPEGTLSPDGHRVYAGKPAYVPELRPNTAPAVNPEPVASEKIVGIRPLPRPNDLVAKTQEARLGGRTLAQIGKVQPLPRPASPQETEQTASPDAPLSKLAIATSKLPTARPPNFTAAVNAALAAVAIDAAVADAARNATTTSSAPVVKQASVSTKSTKAPILPTRANVAKEATVKNAIKLSSINLIGVYGSNADRRALVRLKSGRYVKVQIGDRLDGGRVAAIGTGELKYVKSGRNVTLKMPTG